MDEPAQKSVGTRVGGANRGGCATCASSIRTRMRATCAAPANSLLEGPRRRRTSDTGCPRRGCTRWHGDKLTPPLPSSPTITLQPSLPSYLTRLENQEPMLSATVASGRRRFLGSHSFRASPHGRWTLKWGRGRAHTAELGIRLPLFLQQRRLRRRRRLQRNFSSHPAFQRTYSTGLRDGCQRVHVYVCECGVLGPRDVQSRGG